MPAVKGGRGEEISVQEARERVLAAVRPLEAEEVALAEAGGRVLAEDLVAPRDLPPWDNSQMDGYAVRAEDLREGAELLVVETVLAGGFPEKGVGPGEAIRIMTGAPMPAGADTVIPVEATQSTTRERVRITGPRPAQGEFVRRAGEDMRAGSTPLLRGTVLGAAATGVVASLGRPRVRVHRRPRVAIVATGDELVDPGEEAGPRRIYASSSHALMAAIRAAGGVPEYGGIAVDTREALHAKLSVALPRADVLLTTGGVSAGEADHVWDVLESLKVETRFRGVAQRPGYPLVFGVAGSTLVFGLPGNPVSTMVCYEVYVRPALLRLQAHPRPFPPVVEARLEAPVKAAKRFQMLRAVLRRELDGWSVRALPNQSSGALTSMLQGNALLLVPSGDGTLPSGERVRAQVLDAELFAGESAGW